MSKEEIKELAENHWIFVEGLLDSLPGGDEAMQAMAYLYIKAFIHGYKHGKVDSE